MQSYINEKQQKRKKLVFKIKIYSGLLFFLSLIIGIAYLIIYSHLFQIKNINLNVLSDDINDQNKIAVELGLFFATASKTASLLGANNILIWRNQAEEFLKIQPSIIALSIKKDFLKRSIDINVVGRQKFGILCTKIECWWFDKEGIAFKKAPQVEGEIIYKINEFSERKLGVGDAVLNAKQFENAIKIFEVLEEAGLNIKTLNINDLELQETYIESPLISRIYFSLRSASNFNEAVFENLKRVGLEKIEYVDLRVENRVYYKLK